MKAAVLPATLTLAACLSTAQPAPVFDGSRAFEHVRKLVDIGPRVAGTEGAAAARDYIKAQLAALGIKAEEQAFDATTPLGTVRMVNLRAIVPGNTGRSGPRLLITGRRVTGSSFGGVKGRTQVPQLVDRWLAGEIDVESLLSHRLTLDEVNRGFELMEKQDGIRSVITFA